MQYHECPHCGCNLDHGEICTCQKPTLPPEVVEAEAVELPPIRCARCLKTVDEMTDIIAGAEQGDLTLEKHLSRFADWNPEQRVFLCPDCADETGYTEDAGMVHLEDYYHAPLEPRCRGCGKRPEELGYFDTDQTSEECAAAHSTWNPELGIFLCEDCFKAAGCPAGMLMSIEDAASPGTGLIVAAPQGVIPFRQKPAEAINPDVLPAALGDDEEPQQQGLYTCKYCGQQSFNPGCACSGAEAEQRREAAERGRENAHRDMAELLFPRFVERDDDGYKSDPDYQMYVAVIDRVIAGGVTKATIDIDCENKVAFTVKDYQVQMQLTRTIKTAKSASVA